MNMKYGFKKSRVGRMGVTVSIKWECCQQAIERVLGRRMVKQTRFIGLGKRLAIV